MAGLGRTRSCYYVAAAAALLAGCDPVLNVESPGPTAIENPPAYQSVDGPPGRIAGRMTWSGDVPAVVPFLAMRGMGGPASSHLVPNPFAPRVDPATRGLAGAVVYLRGVRPDRAKPWCLPPVTVDVAGDRLAVSCRFVPVGGSATFVSREPTPQMVRGRGDSFFALALPDPDVPRTRTFDHPGRVELSSGAGQFWMQADLFVCDHPYYAVTDDAGRFAFDGVPPGKYELVAWHRDWRVVKEERDPDTGLVARLRFEPPLEVVRWVTVEPGGAVEVSLSLGQPATK
jgi:hypothetical protein